MYKFKEQDTTWLQIESVVRCAKGLGYMFNGRAFYKVVRRPTGDVYKGNVQFCNKTYFCSFDDMQAVHNKGGCSMYKDIIYKFWYAGYYDCDKIVKYTTLQYNKKLKKFQVQNNMVKFV